MKKYNGFTLIELLVVVLIIGILAAIALPQYNKAVEKSRLSQAITMMNSLERAVDMWLLEHPWPSTSSTWLRGSGTKQDELVVDLAPFNCGTQRINRANGHGYFTIQACLSKHFGYAVGNYHSPKAMYIYAFKINDLTEDPSYELEIDIYPTGEREKVCYWTNDIGKHVCQSLEAQGWASTDEV